VLTGSFVASTLAIKNEDFLAGKASAPVTNRGHINVSNGGFVALLDPRQRKRDSYHHQHSSSAQCRHIRHRDDRQRGF
jgi:hypothetical protein